VRDVVVPRHARFNFIHAVCVAKLGPPAMAPTSRGCGIDGAAKSERVCGLADRARN